MPAVSFLPFKKTVEVEPGTDLLDAARRAGVPIDAQCGGKGTCGRCMVRIVQGDVSLDPSEPAEEAREAGLVRACKTRTAKTELVVELPAAPLLLEIIGQSDGDLDELPLMRPSGALIESVDLELSPPQPDDGMSDLDRLLRELGKKFPDEKTPVPVGVLRSMADVIRADGGRISATCAAGPERRIVRLRPASAKRPSCGIAVDLGTTTVSVLLVELESGAVIAGRNGYNRQIPCGADVISRINYAGRPGGLEELRSRALGAINDLVKEACARTGIEPGGIDAAVVSGNTVMTHLLLGLSPEHLRLAPYTPTLLEVPEFSAGEIGLSINPSAPVRLSPCAGSYVGGDITAGVLLADFPAEVQGVSLFIDIGTNGELVIGSDEFLMACACSAGPAFEGGGIDCGMRAAPGAIARVTVDADSGLPGYSVMGDGAPRGICGSGMITLLSELLTKGWIDHSGRLVRDRSCERIREQGRRASYILVPAEGGGREISIGEPEIGSILRAKAAVYSACSLLLSHLGMGMGDLSRIYVAGGFGRELELEAAVNIGLLPDLPAERFVYLGNASLKASYMLLLSAQKREMQRELWRRMTYIDLSSEPSYMDHYTAALFLPHTDFARFPSVMKRMKRMEK